jgi:hypothetical protein
MPLASMTFAREAFGGRRSTTRWEADVLQFVLGLGVGIVGAITVVRTVRVALRQPR